MPQIVVNVEDESPASLSLLSRLLQDYAILKAKLEQQAQIEYPAPDSDAPVSHRGSDVPSEIDPAKLFGSNKPGNVLPFPSATTAAPAAVASTATSATPTDTTAPAATAPSVLTVPPQPAPTGFEYDVKGIPWDARIHSSSKVKKKDGTWKVLRGADPALVTMVLHEITPKPHIPGGAVQTVAPPVAVPVPVPPQPGSIPPALLPRSDAAGTVPLPAVPAVGAVPVAPEPLNPMQQFQAFMLQVQDAQNAGQLTISKVMEACAAEGLPQIQLLVTAPDKIPAVKRALGLP